MAQVSRNEVDASDIDATKELVLSLGCGITVRRIAEKVVGVLGDLVNAAVQGLQLVCLSSKESFSTTLY